MALNCLLIGLFALGEGKNCANSLSSIDDLLALLIEEPENADQDNLVLDRYLLTS